MKKWFCLPVCFLIAYQAMAQSVMINEVCYTNRTALTDNEGNTPDWLELYNPGPGAVNLRNYKVTDDTSKTEFWTFPDYTLQSGSFLIVFASDKDTVIGPEFHTGFKLGNMKESLFLINPSDAIIDVIYPQCVPADKSLARIPDGASDLVVINPTPGTTNNNATIIPVNYLRDTLTANVSSGFYNAPVLVSLAHTNSADKIVYTLDGDDPDDESEVYNKPLPFSDLTPQENRFANIPETTVEPGNKIFKANILRAVVYSSGCPASNEINNTYFINPAIKASYKVPIVSLITDKDNLFDDEIGLYVQGNYRNFDQHGSEWERPVHIEIFDSLGTQVIDQDGGMRIHGRGSRRSPQKSLRLYADAGYGKAYFEYPLFSQKPWINKFRVILLRNTNGTLGSLFKEELCNYLVQDMNIDYQAGNTIILFINGEYWGIYNLMERENSYYVENNFNISNVRLDVVAYDREVVVEEGSLDAYNDFLAYLASLDPTSDSFFDAVGARLDVNEMIDYFIAKLYLADTDWPLSNLEMWKTYADTAKWRFFMFDSDGSMEWLDYDHLSEYNNDIDEYQRFPEFCTVILKTMIQNEAFRELFRRKFYEHVNTTFSTSRVLKAISYFEKKYAPLIPDHIYRWHNPVDYRKWQEHVASIKDFAVQRPSMVMEQLSKNFGNPFSLYPNPNRGSFSIEFVNDIESMDISIYSTNGVLMGIWSGSYTVGIPLEIHTTLPAGVYLLHVLTKYNSFVNKLIIQ
jgi:hypothetical protein